MPSPMGTLKERLARYRQVKISVVGRKSGQTISVPVWFMLEGENLFLLPVQGSGTQWYKNFLNDPQIRIGCVGLHCHDDLIAMSPQKNHQGGRL